MKYLKKIWNDSKELSNKFIYIGTLVEDVNDIKTKIK